jgi:hypothetical protein
VSGPQLRIVTVAGTPGWLVSAQELQSAFGRCGVRAELLQAPAVPGVRTLMATDFVQARTARRAVAHAGGALPLVYCSITAALLWPRPGAIWLDTLGAENRPGRHGLWQRALERRRLAQAQLVLTMSERSLSPLGERAPASVVVPVPVERSGPIAAPRDLSAVTYAGDPAKKRLDVVLEAWRAARREGETLVVAGGDGPPEPGVRFAGRLPRAEYRALVRRSRLFLAAPWIEDYGTAQLEALADGCLLVTAPGRGPYPARELARRIDPRLVSDELAVAIRIALDDPLPGYASRAMELLAPFRRDAVDRTLRHRVLPVLLG